MDKTWVSVSHSVVSDCSLPGSSVHEIPEARILEWVAISSSRGWSCLGIEPWSIALQVDSFTVWATREAHWSKQSWWMSKENTGDFRKGTRSEEQKWDETINQVSERETRACIQVKCSWVDRDIHKNSHHPESCWKFTDEAESAGFAWRVSIKGHAVSSTNNRS